MIDSYTKKYSKDKLIFPQNYSIVGFNSFTDLADLEKDIGLDFYHKFILIIFKKSYSNNQSQKKFK